jgi:23S rRNA (uracil1939-C5)-methyltransferase/tRNA (uracil-5-)-methyltransferase
MPPTESHRPPPKFKPHPFAYHQELEVTIDSLTNEGVGVARVDGWVVFIAFALPGERVKCKVFRNHKSYSEADLSEVIEPSADRREPVCALFGTCGGCQYQNLDYNVQLGWKRRQVAELLQRMAKIDFPVEPVVASPRQFGYRSKITPHFHRPKDGEVGAIGFLRAGTRSRIVDVSRCDIAMDELNAELGALRAGVRAGALDFKNGATLLLRAAEGRVLTRNDEKAAETVNGMRLEFQAGDFFQNNPFILPAFVDHVIAEAKASGARYLVDAYCGSGLFGICAAPYFEAVKGVEISETAVVKARHNATINGLENCEFIAADAQRIFEGLTLPAGESVVIVDPPRAGCSPEFLVQMFSFGPRAVVYVSCNPATQMRDLALFVEAGFDLQKVQPFDLFPQTRHLECVMTLVKKS